MHRIQNTERKNKNKNIANFPKQIFDYIPFIESQNFPTRVIKIYRKTLCPGA